MAAAKFSWLPYPGATGYNVYRATELDPFNFVLTETNIPLSVLDIDCEYVKIEAITPIGNTPMDCPALHYCPLTCVNYFLTGEPVETMDLAWDAYPTATGYNVYISEDATPDDFVLAYSNIALTTIPINCQSAIVTALTPQGETPQCDPVHYCFVPPSAGPLAYYKCDEASPAHSLVDSIGGYNLDINFGDAAILSPGIIGTSVQINRSGAPEWTQFPSDGHFDLAEFTIRFWIWTDSTSRTSDQSIIFNDRFAIWLRPDYWDFGNGYITYNIDTDDGDATDDPNDPLIDSAWNHVVIWYAEGVGSVMRINNGTDHLKTDTSILTPHTNLAFRVRGWNRIPGISALDEIGIWDRVLTDAEIIADYNGGAGVTYP